LRKEIISYDFYTNFVLLTLMDNDRNCYFPRLIGSID